MKRFLILLVCGVLVLSFTGAALGAVHNDWGDFNTVNEWMPFNLPAAWHTWYYVTPETPYLIASVGNGTYPNRENILSDGNEMGMIYYKNDQTFGEVDRIETGLGNAPYLSFKGSFAFDNGIFVGLKHSDLDYSFIIGPGDNISFNKDISTVGYKLDLGCGGYLAFSDNFYSYDANESGGGSNNKMSKSGNEGYGLDFRYYLPNLRLYGQLMQSQDDSSMAFFQSLTGLFAQFGLNYKVSDQWVLGLEYYGEPQQSSYYDLGATFTEAQFELDLKFTHYSHYINEYIISEIINNQNTYDIMGLYAIQPKLSVGAEYKSYYDYNIMTELAGRTTAWSLVSKYDLNKTDSLRISYELGNSGYDPELKVAYYKTLK